MQDTVKVSRKSTHADRDSRRSPDYAALAAQIKTWAGELGFQSAGISRAAVGEDGARLQQWLADGFHGEMDYMRRNFDKRVAPPALEPGTLSVISVRLDYLPAQAHAAEQILAEPARAYVSRYALGRDYHKVVRRRLQKLAERIHTAIGDFGYRAFADSAPVLEKAIARNAGLGWIGKHTNLLDRQAGSWFFLGELFTDLPLPEDTPAQNHCGTCRRCIDICPTQAIVAPYRLDARRCISYLTIELRGSIPEALRPGIGNRIYGCDDCQLVCPWNRFARFSGEDDFQPRHHLDRAELVELFAWSQSDFETRTLGSAIRRIGYECWLRNIAVALGNAPHDPRIVAALRARQDHASALVREHVGWALAQHAVE